MSDEREYILTIPNSVTNLSNCFKDCTYIFGNLKIDATNLIDTGYTNCFLRTATGDNSLLNLYGRKYSILEKLYYNSTDIGNVILPEEYIIDFTVNGVAYEASNKDTWENFINNIANESFSIDTLNGAILCDGKYIIDTDGNYVKKDYNITNEYNYELFDNYIIKIETKSFTSSSALKTWRDFLNSSFNDNLIDEFFVYYNDKIYLINRDHDTIEPSDLYLVKEDLTVINRDSNIIYYENDNTYIYHLDDDYYEIILAKELISFFIKDDLYYSELNMSWEQWINSKYNKVNWEIDETTGNILNENLDIKLNNAFALPIQYTQVEYIESTGTQYIDTGFIPNQDTRVVVDALFTSISTAAHSGLFGARRSSNSDQFLTYWNYSSTKFAMRYGGNTGSYTVDGIPTDRNTIDLNKNTLFVNNIASNSAKAETFTAPCTLYVFAVNNNSTLQYPSSNLKLYSCLIYDNDSLVRDYIPCIDTNGIACLYDLVNQKPYYNAGTGQFINGEILEEPIIIIKKGETCIPIEYLESTGTQYIDTGFIPNQDTRVIIETLLIPVSGDTKWLFGARTSSTSLNFTFVASTNNYYIIGYNNAQSKLDSSYNTSNKFIIDMNKNITNLTFEDGTTVTNTGTYSDFTCPSSAILFGAFVGDSSNSIIPDASKVYSCKIYDNDILIRDYIPCIDENGIGCMYDKVNNKLYYNEGTGDFILGPMDITKNTLIIENETYS